jgi:hypothetical protein
MPPDDTFGPNNKHSGGQKDLQFRSEAEDDLHVGHCHLTIFFLRPCLDSLITRMTHNNCSIIGKHFPSEKGRKRQLPTQKVGELLLMENFVHFLQ